MVEDLTLAVLQQLSKETFVQGTVVQAYFSPTPIFAKIWVDKSKAAHIFFGII